MHGIVESIEKTERIVHAFAWFRNWLHQINALCFKSLFKVKFGYQRKCNNTNILSAFSLAKKLNLLLERCNSVVTSWVGHMLSIFGDNHVMWSETKYYHPKGSV